MPAKTPALTKKKPAASKTSTSKPAKVATKPKLHKRIRARTQEFLARRPHRSFRRTRRRDYVRSLKLPGYFSFTNYVRKTLWQNKKLFLLLACLYGVLTAALVGLASQETYTQLSDTLQTSSGNLLSGNWGAIGKAGLLMTTSILGGINQAPTDTQQVFAALIGTLVWLSAVWLLRGILAGQKPRLRDALYNSGSPILPTLIVGFVVVLQLLPIALAAIGFGAAVSSGFLTGGVEAMLFWVFAGLLILLSLYWITTGLIALVVVTLPGMYPMKALKIAGDLVIGRRVRILLRLLWAILVTVVLWAVIMIPIILLDSWIKGMIPSIQWLPVVPVVLLIVTSITVIWMASYMYLLYRRIVDDDAAPA